MNLRKSGKKSKTFDKRIITSVLFAPIFGINGCTTMKNFSDVGDSVGRGDYLEGSLLLILGTPGSLLIDAVTFGGTMSVEDGTNTWIDFEKQRQGLE